MATITIEIINWEKYNPKRDQKSYTWFRFDNAMPLDADFFELDSVEKWAFVCLLCEASRKNSAEILINFKLFETFSGLSIVKQKAFFKKLEEIQVVRINEGLVSCSRQSSSVDTTPTNERTDERTPVNGSLSPTDLAELWNENLPDPFPKIRKTKSLSSKRKSAIKARLRENPNPEYWTEVFKKIRESNFLKGQSDRGWVADFDWLMRPDSAEKVLEGKYKNFKPSADQSPEFKSEGF